MGACASKFSVLKNATDAPPPPELASRDVNLEEEAVVKKNDAPAAVADDETKHQSLGHLFKENKDVKQENENVKSPEPVADAPAKAEVEKAEDAKPAIECVEIETEKLETAEKVETLKTEKREENKADEISCTDKKPETPSKEETVEQNLAPDADEKKEEEKLTENINIVTLEKGVEQKPASEEEEKKSEEKPTGNAKIGTSDKVEDKHVLEPPEAEKCLDTKSDEESVKKPETQETSSEEEKPASDAEKLKAEEEKKKE